MNILLCDDDDVLASALQFRLSGQNLVKYGQTENLQGGLQNNAIFDSVIASFFGFSGTWVKTT